MPFTSEEVELLLQISRDASAGRCFRERVDSISEALRALVPHSTISAFVVDLKSGREPRTGHLIFYDRDPGALAEYATHYRTIDPMGVAFPECSGQPYLLSDFCRTRDFGKEAFTSDYLPSIGVRHIMALSHRMPGGDVFALAIHREKGLKDYSTHERELVRLASPDIGRAIHGVLLGEKVAALASSPVGAEPRSGAMLFDARGDVSHADANALTLARQLGGGRVPAEMLHAEVSRLLATAGPSKQLDVERIHALPSGGWLRIRYSRLGSGKTRHVIALFELLDPGNPECFEALATRCGLTAREKEVARLAVRGLGNRQIGAALRISAVTVGIHLGHVYKKTQTMGRHELAALFNGGAGNGGRSSSPPLD